mmetsp:Transcript_29246/g.90411  ORF Transcript_29246/g.90411 Transcript_29246/m.90411 type:complete len:271 (+) Transcript_29246:132-944(+)
MPCSLPSSSTTGTRPTVVTKISSNDARGVSGETVWTCVFMKPFTVASSWSFFSARATSDSFNDPRRTPSSSTTGTAFRPCASNRFRASRTDAVDRSVTTFAVMTADAVGSAGICERTRSRATSNTAPGVCNAARVASETAEAAARAWPPPPNAPMTARRSTVAAPGRARPIRSRPLPCSQPMMSTSAAVSSNNSSTTAARPGTYRGVLTATVAMAMPRYDCVSTVRNALERTRRWSPEMRSTPNSAIAAWDAPSRNNHANASASRAVVVS